MNNKNSKVPSSEFLLTLTYEFEGGDVILCKTKEDCLELGNNTISSDPACRGFSIRRSHDNKLFYQKLWSSGLQSFIDVNMFTN